MASIWSGERLAGRVSLVTRVMMRWESCSAFCS